MAKMVLHNREEMVSVVGRLNKIGCLPKVKIVGDIEILAPTEDWQKAGYMR